MNRFLVPLICLCFWMCACEDEDNDCGNDFQVTAVEPSANPAGFEVIVRGDGLETLQELRFGTAPQGDFRWESNLNAWVAEVPAGLSGPVDLLAGDGACRSTFPFEVLSAFPANIPLTLNQIFVPVLPPVFPPSIDNFWTNLADPQHAIELRPPLDGTYGIISKENLSIERHFGDKLFLQDNPISGTFDTLANTIQLAIERDEIETFSGTFIDPSEVTGFPGASGAAAAILLTSEETGRQYVFWTGG